MSRKREAVTENVQLNLFNQVDGVCPICTEPLQYEKNGKKYKSYEVAHIYPLNPTSFEEHTLLNVDILNSDVNHEDNLIALCRNCHNKFDKPRTIEEYNKLLRIKKECINRDYQRTIWIKHSIDDALVGVIQALCAAGDQGKVADISMVVRQIDEKIDKDQQWIFKQKIKSNVAMYYNSIKNQLILMDKLNPGVAERVSMQIKLFYLQQKAQNISQEKVFENICHWIHLKTGKVSLIATELVASFFIQNCEIF